MFKCDKALLLFLGPFQNQRLMLLQYIQLVHMGNSTYEYGCFSGGLPYSNDIKVGRVLAQLMLQRNSAAASALKCCENLYRIIQTPNSLKSGNASRS